MVLTNKASGQLIALIRRFDYNREGAAAEKYRLKLLELSERRAADMGSEEKGRILVFAEDILYAAENFQREMML